MTTTNTTKKTAPRKIYAFVWSGECASGLGVKLFPTAEAADEYLMYCMRSFGPIPEALIARKAKPWEIYEHLKSSTLEAVDYEVFELDDPHDTTQNK